MEVCIARRNDQCLWSTLTLQVKEDFFVVASLGWRSAPGKGRRVFSGRREGRRSHSCSVLGAESLLYQLSGTCAWEDELKALCARILREPDRSLQDLAVF